MDVRLETYNILNRLDGLSPWAFTGSLYLARWIIIIPIGYALGQLGVSESTITFDASAIVLFFGFIFLAPLLETVLECVVPYWLMLKLRRIPAGKRPWGFVAISGMIMTLVHIGAWPAALLPSFVTGAFLAYTYGHFAVRRLGSAILHTWAFHAAINIVGWILVVGSG
jgi:hypothetical protein